MKSHRPFTSQGFTLVEIMIVVVVIVLLGTMAVPAYRHWHQAKQDKLVLDNARMLTDAADQYFLENGVTTEKLTDLVGPNHKVKELKIVAGEKYPEVYTQGVPITITGGEGKRTLTYSP